jgi:hypothetical protein
MESSSLLTKAGEVSAWPGALAVRFGPLPFSAMRRMQCVLNTTGQLRHLIRRGPVVRVSKGVYDVVRPEPAEMPASIDGTRAAHGA